MPDDYEKYEKECERIRQEKGALRVSESERILGLRS